MYLREGILLALAQIRAQKLKSFFAVIGVVIGVMFLMTVVSVIEGMNRYMKEDFARTIYGLNTITLRRTPSVSINPSPEELREWRRRPRLTFEDAEAIREQLDVPALIAVESDTRGRVEADNGTEVENVFLTAASADYFRIRDFRLTRGRLFTAPEDRLGTPVVVLGHETADKLFGARDPIGKTVKIAGHPFRVIGVLEKQGSLLGISMDNRAIAPSRSPLAREVNPHGVVDNILIRTADEQQMARALLEVEAIMRVRHRLRPDQPNDFALDTADDSMSFWTRITQILYFTFPVLVGIALVVGGMVIMNIMLVSVMERTREIGMRMAIGARRRDIVFQVLVESATLSGFGALVGIGIGIGLAQVVRAISPLPATLSPTWMIVSILLGAGVGIIAGLYPAIRASRLDPVVALRYE